MTALLNALLEVTVYAAALFGGTLAFKKIFYKHLSASMHYLVWTLLLARLLLPVTINSSVKLFVIPEKEEAAAAEPQSSGEAAAEPETGISFDTEAALSDSSSFTWQRVQKTVPGTTTGSAGIASAVSGESAFSVDWQAVLVLVWAAGVLSYFGYILYLHRRFWRNLRTQKTDTPRYVKEIVDACKKELGIRADIPVYVQKGMISPALTLSLRPILLLPAGMVRNMSRMQIELSIRHELTHYKRKDYFVSLLLLFLRGIYWFNPVVWAASAKIAADMETACDACVTAPLGKEQRNLYIHTILDLGSSRYMRYALGMGTTSGKKHMEKRIRGMFLRRKSRRFVRGVACLLVPVLLVACFTTACQPTPEEEAVVQKGDNQLEEDIQQTASATDGDTGETEIWTYQKDYDSGHSLVIDAVVSNIDKTNIPVLSVEEAPFEDGEQLETIVSVFCPDATVYDHGAGLTKSEVATMLVAYQEMLYQAQNGELGYGFELPEAYKGLSMEEIESLSDVELLQIKIEELQQDYQDAPDDSDLEEATYQLTYKGGTYQSNMKAVTNGHVTSIDFVNWSTDDSMASGSTFNLKDTEYAGDDSGLTAVLVTPAALSEDKTFLQEKQMVDGYVKAMGIDYMMLDSVSKGEDYYQYYYTRTYSGLQETYVDSFIGTTASGVDGGEMMNLWKAEYLFIETQNGEIKQVYWANPSVITEVDNGNVQVLPWAEIKEKFLKQMDYLLSPTSSDGDGTNTTIFIGEAEIVIDRIELGLTKVLMQDSNDYKLIPTWSFMGYDKNEVSGDVQVGAEMCYVTLNAIDGSVIDRGLMY